MTISNAVQPCRILLADSSECLTEQLGAMLAPSQCELVAVRDGFDVLCRLPGIQPDLLLISSELPRLSGWQVCALLRQSPDFKHLPVVLMLNNNSVIDKTRATLAGASDCLAKPFRRNELEAVFLRLVGHDKPLTAVA